MKKDKFQEGIDYVWEIIRGYQRQIFREIARCENYEHFNDLKKYQEQAILLGNILHDVDEKRFIEEFDLNDSENVYDDIDDPNFNDGGDEYTDVDNDEDVESIDSDVEIMKPKEFLDPDVEIMRRIILM